MEVRRPFIGGTTREERIDVHNIFEETPFALRRGQGHRVHTLRGGALHCLACGQRCGCCRRRSRRQQG